MTQHHGVTVETDQASFMADDFEHFATVSPRPHRSINNDQSGLKPHVLQDFSQQNGNVDRVCFTTGRTRLHNRINDVNRLTWRSKAAPRMKSGRLGLLRLIMQDASILRRPIPAVWKGGQNLCEKSENGRRSR